MDVAVILSGLAVLILLILSALFSGSETALTAASRARIHSLHKQGNRRAKIVNDLMDARERLIGAILLGNNAVNILSSALMTSVMIALFGDAGVFYATIIMTALVLVFAEVLPKTLALKRTERMALTVAPIMRVVVVALSPIVEVVQVIVNTTLRITGLVRDGEETVDGAEEIRGTLALQEESGSLVKTDRDMLDSILDLKEINLDEIMVHRRDMVMVDADQSNEDIINQVLDSPFTRVPMWQGDAENIIGILHAKDLLKALRLDAAEADGLDLSELARDPWFVPETTSLQEQLAAFRARREHFALVVDEYGALMGVVTLEDILEEIVGDIEDEHDMVTATQVRQRSDGAYIVEGSLSIRDLNRHCDWELSEDDAATVAGLVIHIAKKIPEVGETFTDQKFDFQILRRNRNRVTSVLVKPPASEKA